MIEEPFIAGSQWESHALDFCERPLQSLIENQAEFSSTAMSDRFLGTWKLVSTEHFDDYMKALGERCFAVLLRETLSEKARGCFL